MSFKEIQEDYAMIVSLLRLTEQYSYDILYLVQTDPSLDVTSNDVAERGGGAASGGAVSGGDIVIYSTMSSKITIPIFVRCQLCKAITQLSQHCIDRLAVLMAITDHISFTKKLMLMISLRGILQTSIDAERDLSIPCPYDYFLMGDALDPLPELPNLANPNQFAGSLAHSIKYYCSRVRALKSDNEVLDVFTAYLLSKRMNSIPDLIERSALEGDIEWYINANKNVRLVVKGNNGETLLKPAIHK
jgi:hypothetical protein